MRHNIVIAQVGKSEYSEVSYQRRETHGSGELIRTRYSFEAVIRECFKGQEIDVLHLILVGTSDSNWDALLNYYTKKTDEIDPEKGCGGAEFEELLADKLQLWFKTVDEDKTENREKLQIKDIRVKRVIIEQGQSGEELRGNFSDLQKAVNEVRSSEGKETDWDIYFDISNGFRSFPIYIYTLINYLSQTENGKTRCHMFYGMFDSKITVNEEKIAPLVDLQFVDDLMLLINAVSEFQNCGSVKQILEILLNIHPEWDIQIGETEEETLSYAFKMFDYGTNANHPAVIEIGIDLLSGLGAKMDETECLNDAEKMLLNGIAVDFSNRFSRAEKNYPYSYLMVELAKWYHEVGREGNAAIVIQESILTYIIERYPDQIKDFVLMLKYIGTKDMACFDEECDFSEPEYIFNYNVRDRIKNLLQSIKNKNGYIRYSIRDFYKRYQYIKDKIRDIMAHASFSELDDTEEYKNKIYEQIEYLSNEIDRAEKKKTALSDGDAFMNCLFSGEPYNNFLRSRNKKIIEEQEWTPFEEESCIWCRNYNRLLQQIGRMKEITDRDSDLPDEGFSLFITEKDDLKLLFQCIDKWIKTAHKNEEEFEFDYESYYKKGNKKEKGYKRLTNYLEKNWKLIMPILEDYTE